MPMGFGVITVGIVTVVFRWSARRSRRSRQPNPRIPAPRSQGYQLGDLADPVFYSVSVFLLVTMLPWNDKGRSASPSVAAFTEMGIPYADHIMNAVVLTAVLLPELGHVHGVAHAVRPRRPQRGTRRR